MNKRIICLLLSVLMVLVCFAGCGKKTDEELESSIQDAASASTITLSMYLMSEAPVNADQALKIENAVNKITKAKFKTQIKLTFLTEDQYYTVLEENIKAQEENQGKLPTFAPGAESTEAETVWNENLGTFELKYPTIEDYQVDIFYFDGVERFKSYVENEYLSSLDEAIAGSSKALKQYITPSLLAQMKGTSGATYAIPSNRPIGEYTYMLINKEALDLTEYSASYFTSLTDKNCQDFLSVIAGDEEYKAKFVPLYSTTGELDVTGVQFWGIDENGNLSDNFSVVGGNLPVGMEYKEKDAYVTSFANNVLSSGSRVIDQLKALNYYKHSGYYNDEAVNNGKDFAVGYMKGDASLPAKYSDKYEVIVVDKPVLKTNDLFEDMFGVSAYTSDVNRSMEIITYLNTNEDFRNLILYGIEGEDYELVQSEIKNINGESYKTVKILEEDYKMSAAKTGNVLLAYPTVQEPADRVENYKKQNIDSIVSLIMGFELGYSGINIDMEKLHNVRVLSEKILNELMECSPEDFDTVLAAKEAEVKENADAMFHINRNNSNITSEGSTDPDKLASIAYLYYTWTIDMNIYTVPSDN